MTAAAPPHLLIISTLHHHSTVHYVTRAVPDTSPSVPHQEKAAKTNTLLKNDLLPYRHVLFTPLSMTERSFTT